MIKSNTKNNVRLSVSMPWYVHEQLMLHVQPGQVSDFVSAAVSKKVASMVLKTKIDPWEAFLMARNKITKINKKITIRQAIDKGHK